MFATFHAAVAAIVLVLSLTTALLMGAHHQALISPAAGAVSLAVMRFLDYPSRRLTFLAVFAITMILALTPVISSGSLPSLPDLPASAHPLLQFMRALSQLLVPLAYLSFTSWLVITWLIATIRPKPRLELPDTINLPQAN